MSRFYEAKAGEIAQEIVSMLPEVGQAVWELTIYNARIQIAGIYGRVTPEITQKVAKQLPTITPPGVDQDGMAGYPELEHAIKKAPPSAQAVLCTLDRKYRPLPVVPYIYRMNTGETIAIRLDGTEYPGPADLSPQDLLKWFSEQAARKTAMKNLYDAAAALLQRYNTPAGAVNFDALDPEEEFFLAVETRPQANFITKEQRGARMVEKTVSNRAALFSDEDTARGFCDAQTGTWSIWPIGLNRMVKA